MKRLFDDPALPADLRGELQRSQRAARDYDVAAKLPQLREAFETKQPVSLRGELADHDVASSLGRLGGAPVSLACKLALFSAVVGAVVYVAWPEPVAPPPSPSAALPVVVVPPPAASVRAPQPEPPAAPITLQPSPAESPAPAAEPEPPPRPAARSSRREIEQLARIRALLEHEPAAAYRLAARGEQEFPRGLLSEERRALQVLALAKRGDFAAAERKAREFFARYPQSPMREQVEAALHR